jgi:hypothetical protein
MALIADELSTTISWFMSENAGLDPAGDFRWTKRKALTSATATVAAAIARPFHPRAASGREGTF